mgnify:CR=1 FL=1
MDQQNLDNNNQRSEDEDYNDEGFSLSGRAIGWGLAAFVFAIVMVTFNNSGMVIRAGFFAKLLAVIVGSLVGWGGAMIGDAICRFARPTMFFTTGGFFSLVFNKLFWIAGPQLIGLGIGVALGVSQVLSRM